MIRALAENHLLALREKLRADLAEFQKSKPARRQISQAIEAVVDTYHEYYANDPTFRLIWGGVQADPVLRELDVRDTEQNARIFQAVLRPYFEHLPASELYGLCLLICDTTASALRLALDYERPAPGGPRKRKPGTHQAIVRELKTMLSTYLRANSRSENSRLSGTRATQGSSAEMQQSALRQIAYKRFIVQVPTQAFAAKDHAGLDAEHFPEGVC